MPRPPVRSDVSNSANSRDNNVLTFRFTLKEECKSRSSACVSNFDTRRSSVSVKCWNSYGVDADNCDETCRAALKTEILPVQTAFFRNLQLKHFEGDYLFVHPGLRPGCALEEQSAEDLMRIRQPFLDSSQDWGYTLIHGQMTVAEPDIRENRIDIDTGAVWTGRLTAMAFYGASREVIQT